MRDIDTFWELLHLYRAELGYGTIAAIVAVTRHWQRGDPFREIACNGILCALLGGGVTGLMQLFGIADGWGYPVSLWIGYVGTEAVLTKIADRIAGLPSKDTKK